MVFGGKTETSDLFIQGGTLVFNSKSTGNLVIGGKDCESSSGLCSKADLGNIPSKYTATPVGSTAAVDKKTGVVKKGVVNAVNVECAPSYETTGTKKQSKLVCSPKKFKDYAASSPTCKPGAKPTGGAYCSGSLFVGKNGGRFEDASSWQGTVPTVIVKLMPAFDIFAIDTCVPLFLPPLPNILGK